MVNEPYPTSKPCGMPLASEALHGVLAEVLQFLYGGSGRQEVHGHVAAAAERGFEFLQGEEDFAVVIAGVVLRFDIHRAHLAGVLSRAKIRARADVGVIEAISGRVRDEP